MDFGSKLLSMMESLLKGDVGLLDEMQELQYDMLTSLKSFVPPDQKPDSLDCLILEWLLICRLSDMLLPGTGITAIEYIMETITTAYWVGRRDEWLERSLEDIDTDRP